MSSSKNPPYIRPDSLGDTVDALSAALFYGSPISQADSLETALWLADRQGLPGSYAGMFAPTDTDYAFGALTFTGEPIRSGAATGHILSEETCRLLYRLGMESGEVRGHPEVVRALAKSRAAIFRRIAESEARGILSGVYCCATCTVSLWRHLAAACEENDAARLDHGLEELRRSRDDAGRWKRFPFYYTLLALTEITHPAAREELDYAASVAERAQRRLARRDPELLSEHDRRRKIVLERALEIV